MIYRLYQRRDRLQRIFHFFFFDIDAHILVAKKIVVLNENFTNEKFLKYVMKRHIDRDFNIRFTQH